MWPWLATMQASQHGPPPHPMLMRCIAHSLQTDSAADVLRVLLLPTTVCDPVCSSPHTGNLAAFSVGVGAGTCRCVPQGDHGRSQGSPQRETLRGTPSEGLRSPMADALTLCVVCVMQPAAGGRAHRDCPRLCRRESRPTAPLPASFLLCLAIVPGPVG